MLDLPSNLPPDLQPRPKFAGFLFDRDMTFRDAAKVLPCSHEQIRRICLPIADPDRQLPSDKLREAIASWTRGQIGVGDWPALAAKRVTA